MQKTGKSDIGFSVLWVILGLYVSVYSHSLGLGTVQTPGAGFMPFFFGLILTGFSVINLAAQFGKANGKSGPAREKYSFMAYGKVGLLVASLLIYGILVEDVGFLIMTCAVLISLFRIAGCTWVVSIIWGPVIACISYFVFTYLGVMLPAGILRF